MRSIPEFGKALRAVREQPMERAGTVLFELLKRRPWRQGKAVQRTVTARTWGFIGPAKDTLRRFRP